MLNLLGFVALLLFVGYVRDSKHTTDYEGREKVVSKHNSAKEYMKKWEEDLIKSGSEDIKEVTSEELDHVREDLKNAHKRSSYL